jgi:hypothetical protein
MLTNKVSEAIEALDLTPIKTKLMHVESGEGWGRARADAVEVEYRRFLYLVKQYPNEQFAPTVDVDTFWHYHILDTMKYAQDCEQLFGYFLHHDPNLGLGEDASPEERAVAGERMRDLYQAQFGNLEDAASLDGAWCTVTQGTAGGAWCTVTAAAVAGAWCTVTAAQAKAWCTVTSARVQSAWCTVTSGTAKSAWCTVTAKQMKPAWCTVTAKHAKSAWCTVTSDKAKSAWCTVTAKPKSAWCTAPSTKAKSAWCTVTAKPKSAWCTVTSTKAKSAWCTVTAKPKSAWCTLAAHRANSAWCTVTSGKRGESAGHCDVHAPLLLAA